MWQYLISFSAGVYVGTYFNCKPTIDTVSKYIKDNLPEKK